MFGRKKVKIPVEVSARHVHLAKQDLEKLFGVGYELKNMRQLSQPSDFAAQETVDIKSHSGILQNVRVVGPVRAQTQVEISLTDAKALGVNPPIKLSCDLDGSSPVAITGPAGTIQLAEGLIVARRHIHCATSEAIKLGLKNGSVVSVRIEGVRAIVFENIPVRVKDNYKLCLHLDTDEGNAAGINKTGEGVIL
jgi:putative phosphotransacetylase